MFRKPRLLFGDGFEIVVDNFCQVVLLVEAGDKIKRTQAIVTS